MKQEYNHTKVKAILRQVPKTKNKWRILIESWPVYKAGELEPTRITEDPNIFVTTPIFETIPLRTNEKGQEIYPVKRNADGVIMCSSEMDKAACMYADQIRKIRQQEFDKEKLYTKEERRLVAKFKAGEEDFCTYFEEAITRLHPKGTKSVLNNWRRTFKHFCDFTNNKPVLFKDLDLRLCNEFKYYLLSKEKEISHNGKGNLAAGTISQYYSAFKTVLKQAFVEEYIDRNLAPQLKGVSTTQAKRETLSMEELEILGRTPCPRPVVKRAALFTALTGLRHSDVKTIKWKQLKKVEDGWRLDFTQKKTGVPAYLPITDQAYSLCGERDNAELLIFSDLPAVTECNRSIVKWVKAAGLERHFTFHCFRHTFATLLLERGVNLFTIKSLMGHTRVTTTEVYAHIVDASKKQAADVINLIPVEPNLKEDV